MTLTAAAGPATAAQAATSFQHSSAQGVTCTATLDNRANERRIVVKVATTCSTALARHFAGAYLLKPNRTQAAADTSECKGCDRRRARAVFDRGVECGKAYEFRATVKFELASTTDSWSVFSPLMCGRENSNRTLVCTYTQSITPC